MITGQQHPDRRAGVPIFRNARGVPWNTMDEVNFIRQIDKWAPAARVERRELLKGYIVSAMHRVNWGPVDPDAAIACAHRELAAMGGAQ